MTDPLSIEIRRLGPDDGDIVAALASYPHLQEQSELLADPGTLFLVAFEAGRPVGFVLAYEHLRRHGDRSHLFVYEVEVVPERRRLGIATALMRHLAKLATDRRMRAAFVLTEPDNAPANALYASLGGTCEVVHLWDFEYAAD